MELYHHGIRGQRWGVRRYQNADGTLTDAGRKKMESDKDKKERYKAMAISAAKYVSNTETFKTFQNTVRDELNKKLQAYMESDTNTQSETSKKSKTSNESGIDYKALAKVGKERMNKTLESKVGKSNFDSNKLAQTMESENAKVMIQMVLAASAIAVAKVAVDHISDDEKKGGGA